MSLGLPRFQPSDSSGVRPRAFSLSGKPGTDRKRKKVQINVDVPEKVLQDHDFDAVCAKP